MKTLKTRPASAPQHLDWLAPEALPILTQIIVSNKGTLSFGKNARTILPEYVDIGFNPDCLQLFIRQAENQNRSFHVSSTPKKLAQLSRILQNQNIPFPAIFLFDQEIELEGTHYWAFSLKEKTEDYLLRKIKELKQSSIQNARCSQEMIDLLGLYQSSIQNLLRTTSRSIPMEDRRAIGQEAFIDAVIEYNENLYEFSQFAMTYVKNTLQKAGGSYQYTFSETCTLDGRSPYPEDDFSLYRILADAHMPDVDFLLEQEDFLSLLSEPEQTLLQMSASGYSEKEILNACRLSSSQYKQMIISILAKYQNYSV